MSGGDQLDFEIRPTPRRYPPPTGPRCWPTPASAGSSPTTWSPSATAEGKGWYDARVEARAPIPMDPATAVLHYAQEIFEGLKAYHAGRRRGDDVPAGGERGALQRLGGADGDAGPARAGLPRLAAAPGHHRPGVDPQRRRTPASTCGRSCSPARSSSACGPSTEYLYVVIASPVGSYFSGGVQPVTVWVSPNYTRAAPGGTGAAKCGGNYAASLIAQAEAIEHGCDQVVFLDAVERRYVDELGGMNVFFVYDDGSIATPPLTGTILPGITRESVLRLAGRRRARGARGADQLRPVAADAASGRLREVFACGTAAVITPIGTVRHPEGEFTIADGEPGPVTMKLARAAGRHPARQGRRPVRLGAPGALSAASPARPPATPSSPAPRHRREAAGGDIVPAGLSCCGGASGLTAAADPRAWPSRCCRSSRPACRGTPGRCG